MEVLSLEYKRIMLLSDYHSVHIKKVEGVFILTVQSDIYPLNKSFLH